MSTLSKKKAKAKAKSKAKRAAAKKSAPKPQDNVPAPGGTAGPDAQQVPPVEGPKKTKATKKQALASRRKKNAKPSTAIAGLAPHDATDKSGNFKGTPGEDIQAKPPLAPTETRNTVAAGSQHQKPETNMNRAISEHMEKVAPNVVGDNRDVATVAPANVDEANVQAQQDAQDEADKIHAAQEKRRQDSLNGGE